MWINYIFIQYLIVTSWVGTVFTCFRLGVEHQSWVTDKSYYFILCLSNKKIHLRAFWGGKVWRYCVESDKYVLADNRIVKWFSFVLFLKKIRIASSLRFSDSSWVTPIPLPWMLVFMTCRETKLSMMWAVSVFPKFLRLPSFVYTQSYITCRRL